MADEVSENDRIRSYLQAQAAKQPIEEIRRRVQEGVDALHAAIAAFEPSLAGTNPPGDEWSPLDCLRHSVASNIAVSSQVLHAALMGELPQYEEPELPPAVADGRLHPRGAQPVRRLLEQEWREIEAGHARARERACEVGECVAAATTHFEDRAGVSQRPECACRETVRAFLRARVVEAANQGVVGHRATA
jgi:hypothetical protein